MTQQPTRAVDPARDSDVPLLGAARRALRAAVPRNTRFKAYFWVLDTPVLSELYVRGRGRLRHRRVRPDTKLVLEAFPSSGSSYCLQALLLCNPGLHPNEICSHTHSPRVVKRGIRVGVPCIVVARHPRDAVSSMVQRFAGVHLDSAFDYYAHYYGSLVPLRHALVVAPFDEVVSDFSAIIERCNERFGTDLVTPAAAGVSNQDVWDEIENRQRRRYGGKLREATISRPTASRKKPEEVLRDLTDGQTRAMNRAVAAYVAFVAGTAAR